MTDILGLDSILPVTNSMAPDKTLDNKYSMAGSLEYGLENGTKKTASEMSLDEFTQSITGIDMNYNYVNVGKNNSASSDSFLDKISGYAGELGEGVTNSIESLYNQMKEGVEKGMSFTGGLLDSVLIRIVLMFAVLIVGLWFLAKSGLLKQAAGLLV